MDTLFGLMVGVGLAAACGFRIFVPMLVMNIAAQTGNLELGAGFEWIGSSEAFIVFLIATGVEVLGYYIPWVDNLLDTIATPVAIVAGVVVTASFATELSPVLQWSIAAILGGGAAGVVQIGTSLTRVASSTTTGGLGNPLVSTGEVIGAGLISILAILLPILGIILVALIIIFALRKIGKRARSEPST